MKQAVPKLSLTGPKGPPRHSAAGMAEGRLFCPKLSYFGLTQSKVRPYSRPHPLNAHPINVIEPHGLEDARPVSRESERVNTPSPHPPRQLFLVSLALSQKWFRDFKKKKALLSVFPALPVSYFFRIREKADTQETEKLGSV